MAISSELKGTTYHPVSKKKSARYRLVFLLLFVFQLPSLYPLIKYTPQSFEWLISFYFLLMAYFYAYILKNQNQRSLITQKILNSKTTTILLVALLILANLILYPYELARQVQGLGTDSGYVLVLAGKQLLAGHFPYLSHSYLAHDPIDAGPGWVMLAMPFTCTGLYILLTPFLIALSAFVIQKITKSHYNANIFLILLFSSLAFLRGSVNGCDYIAIGTLFGLLTIFVFNFCKNTSVLYYFSMLITGMIATARTAFFYFGPLLGILIWKRNKTRGIYFALTTLGITILIHLGFYFWNPTHYHPFQVFSGKYNLVSGDSASHIRYYTAAFFASSITAIIFFLNLNLSLKRWLLLIWLCLTVPLLILDVNHFLNYFEAHHGIRHNGGMYSVITMPILAMWASLRGRA